MSLSYEQCIKPFAKEDDIQKHLQLVHSKMNETSYQYECKVCEGEDCDNTFHEKIDLDNHKGYIHGSKNGCQPCDKTFLNEENMMNHFEANHDNSPLETTFFNPSANY